MNSALISTTLSKDQIPTASNSKRKFPICLRAVARNHRAIPCDDCKLCYHIKCGKVTPQENQQINAVKNSTWHCPSCLWKSLPFPSCNSPCLRSEDSELHSSRLENNEIEEDQDCKYSKPRGNHDVTKRYCHI